jgi:hypothetical protein
MDLFEPVAKYRIRRLQPSGLFDRMYDEIVDKIKRFNAESVDNTNKQNSYFAHIKGGASIVHHMKINNMDATNLTDDFDILLVPYGDNMSDDANVQIMLNDFVSYLVRNFHQYSLDGKYDNGLMQVKVDGEHLLDISCYTYVQNFDETTMTNFAAKYICYDDFNDYIRELKEKIVGNLKEDLFGNMAVDENTLERMTFSSVNFELMSTIKGLKNVKKYITELKIKREQVNSYDKKKVPPRFLERLQYEVSPEYEQKLMDKYERYKIKLFKLIDIVK